MTDERAGRRATQVVAVLGFLAALMLLLPRPALSQSGLAIEVPIGGALPIGAAVADAVLLDTELSGDGRVGIPRIERLYPNPGFHAGVRVLLGSYEFGYTLRQASWSHARSRCVGDTGLERLPDGTLEESNVAWDCEAPTRRSALSAASADALVEHELTLGWRLRLGGQRSLATEADGVSTDGPTQGLPTTFFLVAAAGPSLSSWRVGGEGGSFTGGFVVHAGGGLELPLSRQWAFVIDTRYRMAVRGSPATAAAASSRAVALERGPLSAIFDWGHTMTMSLAIRVALR